jgi:AAHS family cis,cis-muconate transporter-like MFS transporter
LEGETRALFASAILPGIVTLVLLWKVPDPPSWAAILRGAARGTAGTAPFGAIWANLSLRRTFLLWTVSAIALQFGYYGATSWLPSYLVKDLGVNMQSTDCTLPVRTP